MKQQLNFDALKKNLIDIIKEFQIKLGYAETSMGLYYPLDSLNRLLDADLSLDEMQEVLFDFSESVKETLGNIICTHEGARFCFMIPAEGVSYVYHKTKNNPFLREFIAQSEKTDCTIDDFVNIFQRHSDNVICEKMNHGEFDYLIYFEDGVPDDYRYCIKFEGNHTIYHRFTPKDYEAFEF